MPGLPVLRSVAPPCGLRRCSTPIPHPLIRSRRRAPLEGRRDRPDLAGRLVLPVRRARPALGARVRLVLLGSEEPARLARRVRRVPTVRLVRLVLRARLGIRVRLGSAGPVRRVRWVPRDLRVVERPAGYRDRRVRRVRLGLGARQVRLVRRVQPVRQVRLVTLARRV